MKTLILFLCSIATSPQCYQTPERLEIRYENNQLCHKVAQLSSSALIQQNIIKGWLIGYQCDDGVIHFSPKEKPIIIIPDERTTG